MLDCRPVLDPTMSQTLVAPVLACRDNSIFTQNLRRARGKGLLQANLYFMVFKP
jgi:hypothetical protein